MILQALKEYYDRKASDPESGIAPEGWIQKEIDIVIIFNENSELVNIASLQEKNGYAIRGKKVLAPNIGKQAVKHTNSGKDANLLWDHSGFIFKKGGKGEIRYSSIIETIEKFFLEPRPHQIVALLAFLKSETHIKNLPKTHSCYEQISSEKVLATFQFAGSDKFIFEEPDVSSQIKNTNAITISSNGGVCLITGQNAEAVKCHTTIKGLYGAKKNGPLVSFNKASFLSYGRDQSLNSPVSANGMNAYTTALNHLLDKDSAQRMQVGDASAVFWSAKDSDFEKQFSDFFNESPKDDPDRQVGAVRSLFSSVQNGAFTADQSQTRFYVLGLSPNAARISVRFWIVGTIAEMSARICQHFEDLQIAHGAREPDFLSLFSLLVSTATQGKSENIPPNIAGDTMRSILEGLPYPQTLLQAAIRRIRAEQSKKDKKTGKQSPNVTHERAALIKAYLNRHQRFYQQTQQQEKELTVSLDKENTNIGYRLGRLFATLEKIQQEANPGINATIRDRFYSSASASPVTAFGNLMRGKNHHLAKLENAGWRVNFERLLGEIMSGIPASGYPAHLNLDDQGRFAIGYYHQMQDFYTLGKHKLADKETGEPV